MISSSCEFPNTYGQPGSLHQLPKIELNYQAINLQAFQDSLIHYADSCGLLNMAKNDLIRRSNPQYVIYYNSNPKGYAIIQNSSLNRSREEYFIHFRCEQGNDGYSILTDGSDLKMKELKNLQKRLNSLVIK